MCESGALSKIFLAMGGGFYSILSKSPRVTVLLSVLQFQQAILGRVLLLPYGKP